jgi:hypothetical protein
MYDELNRLRKCFQPRMWFRVEDGEPDPYMFDEGDVLMWVYRTIGKAGVSVFQVGYFMPDGTWEPDGDYSTKEDAAARVNYLNGGTRNKTGC